MAYCNQTLAGIQLDCTSSMGGIKTVYIANYADVEKITPDEDGVITEIKMVELKDAEGNPTKKKMAKLTKLQNSNLINSANKLVL